VLHYLLIFFISPDAVFHNSVNERRQQWIQMMIAELNIGHFRPFWVTILASSWLKTVVFRLWRTIVVWLVIKP